MNDQVLATFFAESRELLESMEDQLLAVSRGAPAEELVHGIFRAAHTIKGSAGLFGFDDIVSFTHAVETVLDAVRDGRLALGEALVAVFLEATDHVRALLDRVEAGRLGADAAHAARADALLAKLREHLPTLTERPRAGDSARSDSAAWHVSLRFSEQAFARGVDPIDVVAYLAELGEVRALVTLLDEHKLGDDFDPQRCAVALELALVSDADEARIESALALVSDDVHMWLVPPRAPVSAYRRLIELLPEEPARLRAAFAEVGSVTVAALEDSDGAASGEAPVVFFDDEPVTATPSAPSAPAIGPARAAPVAGAAPVAQAAPVVPPAPAPSPARAAKATEARTIRVDADRLDQLIDLVGELIIASASAELVAERAANSELEEATSVVSSLIEALRDRALQLRMVKIGATFARFQRVVHDVARELGKDIALEISGEDTELDKTVVEKLGDPLTHLVRNAIDHGIEPAERRVAVGKPARGTLRLNAFHDSGSIVIEVSDDGGGLDRERILAKAVSRGLVEPGHTLTDREVYALVFEPGFSTAETVTNLSGRGVGMDVVRKNITAFRGSVDLESQPGAGTKVIIRLPLTLAIINGFLVSVAGTAFVIPLEAVEECVALTASPGASYVNLRDEVLPLVHARELFELSGPRALRQNVVVVRHGALRAGLVVDQLMGEFQTVIKPLGKVFSRVRGLSGSTILGNGEVALILDVPAILGLMTRAAPSAARANGDGARR